MPDYSKGKIYKLIVDNYDKIYIGSTCTPLSKRLSCHHSEYKNILKTNKTKGKSKSHQLFSQGKVSIILLEDFPCERKEQLHARERYYIELNKDSSVNLYIPTRTSQEYRKETFEKFKPKRNAAYKKYYETHKEQHSSIAKEYREKHKDEIKAKSSIIYDCFCGGKYNDKHKARHFKTSKHLNFPHPPSVVE